MLVLHDHQRAGPQEPVPHRDDLEKIVRDNHAQGIRKFFITDDNLARNKNWEELFDCLIDLRDARHQGHDQHPGRHHVPPDPGFIEKACRAGARSIFIGLENINPDNLLAAKKRQNKITEYREMLLELEAVRACRSSAAISWAFRTTPRHRSCNDIEIIKRELPIDQLYFTNLTPLPGSEDHRKLYDQGTWMDPDMNKYDLNHRVTHHEKMSDRNGTRRSRKPGSRSIPTSTWRRSSAPVRDEERKKKTATARLAWWRFFPLYYGVHPLEGGYLPLKSRRTGARPSPGRTRSSSIRNMSTRSSGSTSSTCRLRRWLKGVIRTLERSQAA